MAPPPPAPASSAAARAAPLVVLALALLGVAVAAWLARVPLQGVAHVQDEIVYELQARVLSEGRLWEEARLPRAAHVFPFVVNEAPTDAHPLGRRYGIFPNGWPLVLAPGVALGLSWLVNPLLHGLLVLVGARLAAATAGPRAALLAAAFLALSPGLLLQAGSRMSHPLCALLAALAALLVAQGPTPRRALALGGALGLLLLTRPVDALALALALALFAPSGARGAWWPAGPPLLLAVGLTLAQNHLLTGDWRLFPQHAWFGAGEPPFPSPAFRFVPGCNALGFGPDIGCEPTFGSLGHTPEKALRGALHNGGLAAKLWLGSPLLLALALAAPARLRNLAGGSWALLALGYGLYWYAGPCLGGRFHHAAAPLVVVAAAAGADALAARLRLPALTPGLLLAAAAWRLSLALPELPGHWGVDARIAQLQARWKDGPALVFVAYGPPWTTPVDLAQTAGSTMSYSAIQRRGMWIEQRQGPLRFAEYQPELVQATAQALGPDLPRLLLVLTGDPGTDRLGPLPSPEPAQQPDLPLPVEPFAVDPTTAPPALPPAVAPADGGGSLDP
ncbi:hypothetical protein L6R53_27675 [Myxococcota bacterium]|nr:hypothetical protein [Myxococcota bacterium]